MIKELKKYLITAEGPGIGDAVWLTAIARQFKKENPDGKLIINSSYPEVFDNNPNVYKTNYREDGFKDMPLHFDFKTHVIDCYCRQLDLQPTEYQQEIFLTEDELQTAREITRIQKDFVTIQSVAGSWTRNKDWPVERWEELIRRLDGLAFIQIGGFRDPSLTGVIDLRGKLSIRIATGAIAHARAHLGLVSGPMHLANAVGTRSVIIFGGREDPALTGYPINVNLYARDIPCAPCWKVEECTTKECLKRIAVDDVENALRRILYA